MGEVTDSDVLRAMKAMFSELLRECDATIASLESRVQKL